MLVSSLSFQLKHKVQKDIHIFWHLPIVLLEGSSVSDTCYIHQIRSVAQSRPTLCNPMNRSTPGLPVHHQLPEFTHPRLSEGPFPPVGVGMGSFCTATFPHTTPNTQRPFLLTLPCFQNSLRSPAQQELQARIFSPLWVSHCVENPKGVSFSLTHSTSPVL